jgi:hypothetical protein
MRKLICGLLVLLGITLVGMIVNSSKLVVAHGERDRLAEMILTTTKNQLDDTATLFSKLANGPSGPGDNQLGDFAGVKQEAQLLKNSRVYEAFDEAPGFRKLGYSFSESLGELQLVLFNLDRKMAKYHYKLGDEDRTKVMELSKTVHDQGEKVMSLRYATWQTDSASLDTIKAYQQKADIVTKQCQTFLEELTKE